MSKSLGNVLLVRDLLDQAPGEVIRLALLSTQYRHPLDWNMQRLATARQMLMRFYTSLAKAESIPIPEQIPPDALVLDALRNDLNIPGALVRLRKLLTLLDNADADELRTQAKSCLLNSAGLLGLLQQAPRAALSALRPPATTAPLLDNSQINVLLAEREQARRDRNFV